MQSLIIFSGNKSLKFEHCGLETWGFKSFKHIIYNQNQTEAFPSAALSHLYSPLDMTAGSSGFHVFSLSL